MDASIKDTGRIATMAMCPAGPGWPRYSQPLRAHGS